MGGRMVGGGGREERWEGGWWEGGWWEEEGGKKN